MKFNMVPYTADEAVETAKALLAATDYAVLPDVHLENVDQFLAYRAGLRDVMKNPQMPVFFKRIPEPIWMVGE
jgi:hypothetical protein